MVSFFANVGAAINFSSVEVAVLLMENGERFEASEWVMSVLDSLVFFGCTLGMLLFGYMGDLFGRLRAMRATCCLGVFGIIIALAPFNGLALEATLCSSRFLVGVGTGGIYPLSAAIAYERFSSGGGSEGSVALANFGQPLGCLVLFLCASALAVTNVTNQAKWRCVLLLGALPFLVAAALTLGLDDDDSDQIDDDDDKRRRIHEVRVVKKRGSLWTQLEKSDDVRWAMAGAGGTWFVYNVYSYGIITYYPQLAASILGERNNEAILAANVAASAASIATAAISLVEIQNGGARESILLGSALGTVYCGSLCVVHKVAGVGADHHRSLALWLFIILRGFIQFPGIGIFTLPNTIFDRSVRSRAQGLAAAIGKLGAILGSALVPALLRHGGLAFVLFVTAFLFAVDGVWCAFLTPSSSSAFRLLPTTTSHHHDASSKVISVGDGRAASSDDVDPLLATAIRA